MPGAERAPAVSVALGVVAYGRFVRGELDAAVEAGERAVAAADAARHAHDRARRTRDRATRSSTTTASRSARVDGPDDRRGRARSTCPSLVAHAYYMRSVAETSVGNRDGRRARSPSASAAAADERGSPTAHAQAAYALGAVAREDRSRRALALLDRSVQLRRGGRQPWIRAFALTESLWIRAKSGQAVDALRGYHDVIDTWFRGGDWANQWLSLRHVFAIFESLGNDEVAATLYGALDAAGVMHALPLEPGNADDFDRAVAAPRVAPRRPTASKTPPSGAGPCATKRSCGTPWAPSPPPLPASRRPATKPSEAP